MQPISRRKFFKSIFILSSIPVTWLWYSTVKRSNEIYFENKSVSIDDDIPNGISFRDDFIFVKQNTSLKIFLSKCSHLGCKIKSTEGNEVVCPCHGSRYDFNGKVLKGPAQNPLTLLRFKKENSRIIIYES